MEAPVLEADIGLDDAPVVEDQRVGDHGIDRALGIGHLALAHAVADHLAAGADHFTNLILRNRHHGDARRMATHAIAGLGKGLRHLIKNMQPTFVRLGECRLHDLFRNARDLDVHLQRGHTFFCAGYFEIHVAEMVFISQNVGEHRKA